MKLNLLLNTQIILSKISSIIKSYASLLFATKAQRDRRKERMSICKDQCGANKICPVCYCPLKVKSLLKENECPLYKW